MSQALRVRLTGRAARFLWMLQDFGHLDDDSANELLVAVTEMRGGMHEEPVDLPLLKRVAAMWLFSTNEDVGQGVLAEDWPLLFS